MIILVGNKSNSCDFVITGMITDSTPSNYHHKSDSTQCYIITCRRRLILWSGRHLVAPVFQGRQHLIEEEHFAAAPDQLLVDFELLCVRVERVLQQVRVVTALAQLHQDVGHAHRYHRRLGDPAGLVRCPGHQQGERADETRGDG